MDQLTRFVAIAHLKLRLEILQRHPEMATTTPTLPAPMEFAGLKSLLVRAKNLEARSGVVRPRMDAALDVIEQGVGVLESHAPELEKYGKDLQDTINGMLVPSNGGPALESALVVPSAAANPTPSPSVAEVTPVPGPNGGPRIHNSEPEPAK